MIHGADGTAERMLGINADITEQKQTEEALWNATKRLLLATQAGGVGIWEYDNVNSNLIWDDQMFKLYGITPETFSGNYEAWRTGVHPEDLPRTENDLQMALHCEKEFNTEFRIIWPDQTIHHLRAVAEVQTDDKGEPTRVIGVNYDITKSIQALEEKSRLESQLQQAQKMESVGRLAGGVAHDFNNMLSVILGHVYLAQELIEDTNPLHNSLVEICKAAQRSAELTKQLLAFARKQTIAPKVLDLNETVTGMLKMLQRLIGENIHLLWQPDQSLWQVKMDTSQVDQILANLCVNARDSVSDIGKITIETGNKVIDEDYCAQHAGFIVGEFVRITVSDNGCGMSKETVAQIFEPFFTTKGVGVGTGLGLATVYGIVKQNNGFINVYSELGLGTTFTIYLPRHIDSAEKLVKETAIKSVKRGQETILLVEDEPAILSITATILERQGYTVLAAITPSEAIKLAQEHATEIHMLMTDVVMPEMNGRDLSKKLLTLYPHLKCLYMSGYTANVIAHHGVLDEGVHFINKPFSFPDLAAKIRDVLDYK